MPEEIKTETPVVTDQENIKSDKELIAEEEAAVETEVEKEVTEEAEEEKPKKEKKEKKPLVLTSDWEEGKVYLYQSNRTPRIPSLFPRELLLETWMKLQGVPYENINLASRLSTKAPFVELNGEKMSGADLLAKLAEKFEKNLGSHLSQEQLNIEHAMVKMVENHLYWFVMDWRTKTEDNTLKAYNLNLPAYFESKLPPAVLSLHFKLNVCKKVQKQRREQGLTNLAELAKQDLKVLSEMLAEKDFMFGSEVSMLDLVLFSVLALLAMVEPEYECEMRDWLAENHHNLLDFVTRLKEKVWADHWDAATGETLDLNPHIPKPEPEPEAEEEKKEEVEEKTDAEKPVEEKSDDDKDGEKVEVVEEEEKEETEKKSILDSFRNLKSRVFSKSKKEDAGEAEEKTQEKTVEEEEEKKEEKVEEKPVEEKSEDDKDGEKVEVVEDVEEKEKQKDKKSIKASFKKLRTRVFSKAKKEDAGEPSEKTEVDEEKKDEVEENVEKKEATEEKKEETKVEGDGEKKEEEKAGEKTDEEKKD